LIVLALILIAVLTVLGLNLNLKQPGAGPVGARRPAAADSAAAPPAVGRRPAGFREYPIGEEVEMNQMRIAAVWLPPIEMDGTTPAPAGSAALLHLEADIHATEGNRNGFAKDEFVPYLTVIYTIVPAGSGPGSKTAQPMRDKMMPMVARDGWHYGANVEMPRAGRYILTYRVEPPSARGLAGRHSDPVTGVEPWWKPFEVQFDWDYAGPPGTPPQGDGQK
jgi:uncharacterized protein involved in high-affinity Fe2+ transport